MTGDIRSTLRTTTLVIAALCATSLPYVVGRAVGSCGDGILEPEADEQCDDSNSWSGDGCAENCTTETSRLFLIDPDRSLAVNQLVSFAIEFPMEGSFRVTAGHLAGGTALPFVIREADMIFVKVAVDGIGCACLSSQVQADEFGPGNVARGAVFCSRDLPQSSAVPLSINVTRTHDIRSTDPDCTTGVREGPNGLHPGACNSSFQLTQQGEPSRGTMYIFTNLQIRLIFDGGTCIDDKTDPAKGPDGIPCTADDPVGLPSDPAQTIHIDVLPGATGRVTATVHGANLNAPSEIIVGKNCGTQPCRTGSEWIGSSFDCDLLTSTEHDGADTGVVALALPVLDTKGFGDSVASTLLVPLARGAYPGDCSRDGCVTANELVAGVRIMLGDMPLAECLPFDRNRDAGVGVDEVVQAVNRAIGGCKSVPPPLQEGTAP